MLLPKPRGAFSAEVLEALRSDPTKLAGDLPEPESHDDSAIALWALYELHGHGFEDLDEDPEWHPDAIALRGRLERDLESRLRERWAGEVPEGDDFAETFFAYVEAFEGPSLARHVQVAATEEQVLDLLKARSIYHLRETDPSVWVVPRLDTRPKAALMEMLYDEFGGGDPNKLHHHLFARGLDAIGLRSDYGAYVDDVPMEALEQNNTWMLIGMNRRLRGAAVGHFAAFEATSSVPSRRIVQGLERLGFDESIRTYYATHVTADAAHEQVAVRGVCAPMVEAEPGLRDDVWFGAFTCLDQEARLARALFSHWGVAA